MGGLYNMLFGYNPGCILLAPMLTDQNPEEFFPRFRDCYLSDDNESIIVYTRVGGGNRSYAMEPPHERVGYGDDCDDDWSFGEDKLYEMPTFIRTWDDDFDETYGYYEFGVPEEWREDFDHVKAGEFDQLSERYIDRMQGCFEKLDVREILRGNAGKTS